LTGAVTVTVFESISSPKKYTFVVIANYVDSIVTHDNTGQPEVAFFKCWELHPDNKCLSELQGHPHQVPDTVLIIVCFLINRAILCLRHPRILHN
jgi:hypothetical protein